MHDAKQRQRVRTGQKYEQDANEKNEVGRDQGYVQSFSRPPSPDGGIDGQSDAENES